MQKRFSPVAKVLIIILCLTVSGCRRTEPSVPSGTLPAETAISNAIVPEIPHKLSRNADGIPVLKVYDTSSDSVLEMDTETYLAGVLAGEMRNDWPIEALKAQAILARTFVMQFVSEKESKYENADISTDVTEAQAYNSGLINERILEAVRETRGLVLSADGEFAYAWFHAHAGGKTELPSIGLDFQKEDPGYIAVVDSPDSDEAPEDAKNWISSFPAEVVASACADLNVNTGTVTSIEIGSRGESGRVSTFVINGKVVSAPSLRIRLGAADFKSTLLKNVSVKDGSVIFEGSGYGHGVGMSQWGAFAMAKEGKSAEEIISHYFNNLSIVCLW